MFFFAALTLVYERGRQRNVLTSLHSHGATAPYRTPRQLLHNDELVPTRIATVLPGSNEEKDLSMRDGPTGPIENRSRQWDIAV